MPNETFRIKILIVDDNRLQLAQLADALEDSYDIRLAANGREGLERALAERVDLIISDIVMPELDGIEFYKALLQHEQTRNIPIIFVSSLSDIEAKVQLIELGASDYITKPYNIEEVRARLRSLTQRLLRQRRLESDLHSLSRRYASQSNEVGHAYARFYDTIINIAVAKSKETPAHLERTKRVIARLLRKYLQLHRDDPDAELSSSPELVEQIMHAAVAHDIGMIGIPDKILQKPGRLAIEEYEVVKKHPLIGYDMITGGPTGGDVLRYIKEIVRSHHERWDGFGYPDGLAGKAIPLSARLMAIADVYDALISRRAYKEPVPHRQAVEIIRAEAGRSFDPALVDIFLNEHRALAAIAAEHPDE